MILFCPALVWIRKGSVILFCAALVSIWKASGSTTAMAPVISMITYVHGRDDISCCCCRQVMWPREEDIPLHFRSVQ